LFLNDFVKQTGLVNSIWRWLLYS